MCVCGQLQSATAPCHVRAITLIGAITLAALPALSWPAITCGGSWRRPSLFPAGVLQNTQEQTTADPAHDFTGVVTMSGLGSDRLYKLFHAGISDCLLWRPSRVENTIKREFKRKIKSNAAPIFPSIISFPDAVSGTFVCLGCRN